MCAEYKFGVKIKCNKVLDLLYLEMAYDIYSQILDYFAKLENAEVWLPFTDSLMGSWQVVMNPV